MSSSQIIDIVVKAALAAGFFFALQFYVMKAPMDRSLVWSASMGICAAVLAWTQHRRRS